MKDSIEKLRKQTTSNEGYPNEVGVELRGKLGVQSDSTALTCGGNDVKSGTSNLLEEILHRDNLNLAYKRVVKNKGSHGIDGMRVDELLTYLKANGQEMRKAILEGIYRPKPVRRVEIPKPDGGIRLLGIPTVVDRVIQQSIAQVLTPIYEKEFSSYSYGFRPGRGCHEAIAQAREYLNAGYEYVVDIDLEKFFDRVNHDKLMSILARKIEDKRVLKLIRKYLESGVMIGGIVSPAEEGVPQGGPLSPILSNIMLNELDKELEKRGHKFCRYADDCNIYVRSKKAGDRVMKSITIFIETNLKLKVNQNKSAVDKPSKRKFLGFSFYQYKGEKRIRIHEKTIDKLKKAIKELTSRRRSISIKERIRKLNQKITGWVEYFYPADIKKFCQKTDQWMRRRLRMCIWKQWKKIKTRHNNLVRLGVDDNEAWAFANTRKGYWRISNSPILSCTLTNEFFRKLGLKTFSYQYQR
jgi:RNA-directed DNA polymerase